MLHTLLVFQVWNNPKLLSEIERDIFLIWNDCKDTFYSKQTLWFDPQSSSFLFNITSAFIEKLGIQKAKEKRHLFSDRDFEKYNSFLLLYNKLQQTSSLKTHLWSCCFFGQTLAFVQLDSCSGFHKFPKVLTRLCSTLETRVVFQACMVVGRIQSLV